MGMRGVAGLPSSVPDVAGNTSLDRFDVVIIGSGPGGSTAARVLTDQGLDVCMLEAGPCYFVEIDDPAPGMPIPLFSNDGVKASARGIMEQQARVEPRTFRRSERDGARTDVGKVNPLPKTVGGGQVHADGRTPRFNDFDFHLGTDLGEIPGADFADWPITYDELEPFYVTIEREAGVSGLDGGNPFESRRSAPFPLPPGPEMYVSNVLGVGARKLGDTPFPYPGVTLTRDDDGRPACNDCGMCAGFGCPTNARGSPAVTVLRKALLTGRLQLRYNATATRLVSEGGGRRVTAVEYLDPAGQPARVSGDRYLLAAGGIESARLCLLSDLGGPGLGNASDRVGRDLVYHDQTVVIGIHRQSLHGERGRAASGGFADFRGVPNDPDRPLGGIIEFATISEKVREAKNYALAVGFLGTPLKKLLRSSPFGRHMGVLVMQGEDAPQLTNRVDLDPEVRDIHGLPAARITYDQHPWELETCEHYAPKMLEIHRAAGAQFGFVGPQWDDEPTPTTAPILGALRMGDDPRTSVLDAGQRFHDLENLWCVDGSVMPTGSGHNPTLTIEALSLRAASNLVEEGSPERVLGRLSGVPA